MSRAGRRHAFTLVELFVVITIIAVLCAILLPVYSKTRKRARESTCLENLHEISVAVGVYVSDYDDSYPRCVDAWDKKNPGPIMVNFHMTEAEVLQIPTAHQVLLPYLKERRVLECPLDFGMENNSVVGKISPSYFSYLGSSYRFRYLLNREFPSCVREPAHFTYAWDHTGEWHSEPNTFVGSYRSCYLYFDGHAKCSLPDPLEGDFRISPCETNSAVPK